MNTKNVIIILIVIIFLHALVVMFFMGDKEESIVKPSDTNGQLDAEKDGVPQKLPPEKKVVLSGLRKKTTNPNFGKRFSYKNAVKGNIPGLKDCKYAKTGILVDLDTRKVLWSKNPRKAVPIASMTKMMTTLLAFELIDRRQDISMNTPVRVTRTAMKEGGSQVFLDVRETFTLGELLKTVEIASANDSARLIADYFGDGNCDEFVKSMNRRAIDLHLPNTKFYNPHGLPGRTSRHDNVSCPESMALIAENLLEYPLAVKWASTWFDYFRENTDKPFMLTNHNRLVKNCPGVDGMKTGFTQRAQFCTTVTCKRGGRRLVAVVTGFPSGRGRDTFIKKLLDWGYKQGK